MTISQKAGLLAALLGATMLGQGYGLAENTTVDATNVSSPADASAPADTGAQVDNSVLLDDATLDAMTSPIALFPDTLLGQVLVATTYPLDVLKADRFLTGNTNMTDKERAAAVNDQDWPDSVKSLAAGFPELITRMAEHSDWTETMGEALVAQTDDVLVSIQRLRAQAKVNGYLEDNAAMNVETDPATENITIASADPDVVYVPEYTNVVYSQPAPTTPYYVYDDDDNGSAYWGDPLAAGAIIFGTALVIDAIFDDDWGNGWDNGYWHGDGYGGGGNSIDWNGDVNIDNGINIGNGNIGSGNRPQIGAGNTIIAGNDLANFDRTKIDKSGMGNRAQVGALNEDQLDRARDANFNPSAADKDVARAKIADRTAAGKDLSGLPAAKGAAGSDYRASAYGPTPSTKLSTKPASKGSAKASSGRASSAKVSRPSGSAKPPTARKPSAKAPAYKPTGGSRASAASSRGSSSRGGGGKSGGKRR